MFVLMESMLNMRVSNKIHLQRVKKEMNFLSPILRRFSLASESDTLDNTSNSNIPQPPSNSTKPTNIRRQPIRLASEPSSNSTESMVS